MMPTADEFRNTLSKAFEAAETAGIEAVEIQAGQLHREVGDYPNPKLHRMPVCCEVMRQLMQLGDEVITAPPKGNGASLTIRYRLPRR